MSMFLLMLAAAMQQSGEAAPPPTAKLICKRIVDTGSLVRGRKDCRTKQEWDHLAWAARQGTESIQSANMGRPPGS